MDVPVHTPPLLNRLITLLQNRLDEKLLKLGNPIEGDREAVLKILSNVWLHILTTEFLEAVFQTLIEKLLVKASHLDLMLIDVIGKVKVFE